MGSGTAWTETDEQRLALRFGLWPVSRIAASLGRSETAVRMRAKKMGLKSPESWEQFLAVTKMASVLGIDNKSAAVLLRHELADYVVTLYSNNRPVPYIPLPSLKRWLLDPMNWYRIDPLRVDHPEIRPLIEKVWARWDDEWWTVGRVARELHFSGNWVNKRINDGRLIGRKRGHNWFVLRSVVEQMKKELLAEGVLRVLVDDISMEQFKEL